MALQPRSDDERRRRDEMLRLAEGRAKTAADRAVRQFLRKLLLAMTRFDPPEALLGSAGVPEPFTAGEALVWWQDAMKTELLPAIRAVWQSGYSDTSTTSSSLDEVTTFLASVQDRLSPRIGPSLPQDAFDRARLVLAQGAALGQTTDEVSKRLAAEFSWDDPATYWRGQKKSAQDEIDSILDPIGPPGDPARELARRSNPRVGALQALNAEATKKIDSVESTWKGRATAISRSESVGAFNFGALAAYAVEGVGCIKWVATDDRRTRESHRNADDQVIRLGEEFVVQSLGQGQFTRMRMPGDPTAPAWATVNCRCTTVAADCP